MKRAKLFKNNKAKHDFLEVLFEDYASKDLTVKEISEKYGYDERQIRYLIDRYLLVRKGRGKRKRMKDVEKTRKIINGKVTKKATLEELIIKADIYNERVKEKRQRIKSTNKKVEK